MRMVLYNKSNFAYGCRFEKRREVDKLGVEKFLLVRKASYFLSQMFLLWGSKLHISIDKNNGFVVVAL